MAANVAIIHGTGSGIGAQIARQYLARTSLEVVVLSRDASRAKEAILSAASLSGSTADASFDSKRLHTFSLDISAEDSYSHVASKLEERFGKSCLKTLWNANGILRPEKNLAQIHLPTMWETFGVNVFSHVLAYKYFVPLIPRGAEGKKMADGEGKHDAAEGVLPANLAVVASLSARVGSIEDNRKGGWYSYRASKAALNQMVKTLSKELDMRSVPAIAVALHPGTVRSELSKDFTGGPGSNQPLEKGKGQFEDYEAAENLVNVVAKLGKADNGTFRDYKNQPIPW